MRIYPYAGMESSKKFTEATKVVRYGVIFSAILFLAVIITATMDNQLHVVNNQNSVSIVRMPPFAPSNEEICFRKYANDIPSVIQMKFYNQTEQIFYNRMPKCASSTTMMLFRKAASMNHWHYPEENAKIWHLTYERQAYWVNDEKTLLSVVAMAMNHPKPMLFSCHFHFIDFTRLWTAAPPTYINIIRKPQDRLVSLYYFFRFAPGHIRPMSEGRRNMTYDECVMKNDPECTSDSTSGYWRLIPYFCGHDPVCRKPSKQALERAKQNVIETHAVIGLTEDVVSFTKVLEAVIPSYFKGMPDIYRQMEEKNKSHVNENTFYKVNPNQTTVDIMRPLLKLEDEFYDFVRRRFYALVDFLKCKGHSL